MAGIGFELKKLFRGQSIVRALRGSLFASFATIGPVLMIVLNLIAMYFILEYVKVSYAERDLLASTILYVFIFSLIITSPLNSVLSRYIADKIYDDKTEDILSSYYVGLAINIIGAGLLGMPFILYVFFVGNQPAVYCLLSYCMYMSLVFSFYNMTYVSALKEYKKIARSFLIGMSITFVVSYVLHNFFGTSVCLSIISGFGLGFLIISFLLFALIKGYFRENSRNYQDTLSYIRYFKGLFATNLFYILGLYVHNFVFWFSDLSLVVAKSYRSAPVYDMATCLAMFTNISVMVIFMVQVEVNFHDRYQAYIQEVTGGTGEYITVAKQEMFSTLIKEILLIIQLQMIITVVIFLIAIIILPNFGFGGLIMSIYPSLAASYFLIFIMYSLIVFMYYFDDSRGALITAVVFFSFTLIASIIATYLSPNFYGIGPFVGAFAGWTYGFYRLRHIERTLDAHIFCSGELVKRIYTEQE